MALVPLVGTGVWMPTLSHLWSMAIQSQAGGLMLMDANTEEAQFIGAITIDGGGSKTFGTSSVLGWMTGGSATFQAVSTLRVGLKGPSKLSLTAGPPARATTGTAAFDVWKDLVGGTDTLAFTTWREDTMTSGTPLTVTDGDLVALCFHLGITSGVQAVSVSAVAAGTLQPTLPACTLVTGGSTFTVQNMLPNLIVKFDDGTLGWLELTKVCSTSDLTTGTIGSGNSIANIVQVPFPCVIDAIAAYVIAGATSDFALEVVATPLGTPNVLVSLPGDANLQGVTTGRMYYRRLPTPLTLTVNTPYALSLKQTTANAVTCGQHEVSNAAYFKPMGMGANCYAANSTAGATFVSQVSGCRRYYIWMRISAVDNGAGGALRKSDLKRQRALRFTSVGD